MAGCSRSASGGLVAGKRRLADDRWLCLPRTQRVLFAYAFAKNAASTLTPAGHEALAMVAQRFSAASDVQIAALLGAGDVTEVVCDGGGEV